MSQLATLFYLQLSIIRNEFRKDDTFKLVHLILVLLIPLFLFSFFGYSIGYLIKYSHNLGNELNLKVLFYSLNTLIFVLMISNIFSRRKILKQITYRNLRFMPIGLFLFLSVDFVFSFFNKINLFLISLLLGLIVGISSSNEFFFLLFFIVLTLILLIHLFVELADAIINIVRSRATIFYLVLGITIAIFIFIYQSKLEQITSISPIGLSINTIVYFPSSNSISIVLNSIFNNIIYFVIGSLVYFFVKWLDFLLVTKNITQNTSPIKISKKITSINIFNEELSAFLLKDIKYIIRSSRPLSQIIFEILVVIIFVLSYHYNLNIFPHNIYVTLFIAIILPVLLWDFYLSNQWGLEKKGFGFYLFAPVTYYKMILAKNISYFIIKIPVLIISTFLFGYFISIDIFPYVIFLQVIINLLLIIIANYNSIRFPFPTDLSENLLSKNSPNTRFSMIGFLGLLLILLFSSTLLFIMWKLSESIITLIIFLILTLFLVFSYSFALRSFNKYFVTKKEKMYNSLCSNE